MHVPRWIRAMLPAGKPVKSAGLAAAGRGVAEPELDVDRRDGGGDVAGLGVRRRGEVGVLDVGDRARSGLLQRRRADSSNTKKSNGWRGDLVAGGSHPLLDVVDRRVVPRRARCPCAVVVVGDRLERLLVLEHAIERDALEQLAHRVVVAVALRRAVSLRRRTDAECGRPQSERGRDSDNSSCESHA